MVLTPKQQRFVEEYLVDLNATAAARRAGYKDPNKGRQLVTKSNIAAAISEGRRTQQQRTQVNADRTLLEYIRLAFSDIGEIIDFSQPEPRLRPACDIP